MKVDIKATRVQKVLHRPNLAQLPAHSVKRRVIQKINVLPRKDRHNENKRNVNLCSDHSGK